MAQITTPVPGVAIQASWGTAIRDSVVQRFVSMAEVASVIPTPISGQVVYTEDSKALWLRASSAWRPVATDAQAAGMIIGGLTVGAKPTTGIEGGQISLAASPSPAGGSPWHVDVYNSAMRFFYGSLGGVLQLESGRVLALKPFTAYTGITNLAGKFLHDGGGDFEVLCGTLNMVTGTNKHGYVTADNVLVLSGNNGIQLKVDGPGKQIRLFSGSDNFMLASFYESSNFTDFKCPIPVLGGGTTVTVQGTGNWQFGRASSSRRYKVEIKPAPSDLGVKLLDLEPVTFKDNPETVVNATTDLKVGLIAEDVAELMPELVQWSIEPNCDCDIPPEALGTPAVRDQTGAETQPEVLPDPRLHQRVDGLHTCWRPDSVDYARLVVPLIQLVKRQNERIDALESTLSSR